MHVLISGCGWLGGAVAQRLMARGDRVTGIRSDPARAERLRVLGIEPLVVDLAEPGSAARIPSDVDAILALQAARGEGEGAYHRAYIDANRTLLAVAQRPSIRAFVYSGSTGLFGQQDGSEVDEHTPPLPTTPTGEILLAAEKAILAAAAAGVPTRIVRLSGLYGPERTWLLERVRQGLMTLDGASDVWMNFCHQDDAASTLIAAMDRGRNGAIYHATDTLPMQRREVISFVAGRLGITLGASSPPTPPTGPNRRVVGSRTRQELGIQCQWPSLREGLEPFF